MYRKEAHRTASEHENTGERKMKTEKCDRCGELHALWMEIPFKICTTCYGADPVTYEALKKLY